MTEIVTITLNPSVDISTSVARIAPFSKLRCAPPHYDPGGGGINVARVIKRLGGDVLAVFPIGGATGQLLKRLMHDEGVPCTTVDVFSETRQVFTLVEDTTDQQFRFVLPGAQLSENEWSTTVAAVADIRPAPSMVVVSGSLPSGISDEKFARAIRTIKASGAKIMLDTSQGPLRAAVEEGVHLIKPNLKEFQDLAGISGAQEPQLVDAARALIAKKRVAIIALSLGADGALLVSVDRALRARPLPVEPVSVVGAGDSFLGALVWQLSRSADLEEALRCATAAGAAAVLRAGTSLSRVEDVRRLHGDVKIDDVTMAV
ncbi:1-phosphofructokinase family hexose kinase [Bradyrhizobium sp. LHD-71]|uniref:1-phosphofructokinase family hexose kinase n=1 Tax=Bradyrhizobium sp. LHD-71 TaxID=3072141 RepID=UPI00280E645A|nr:1-phosphofructokinase family hexose kinase [Bradyrhizobium sp. LHD-71]MDQ8727944.1 1-phosphofructokinase family hexose kinase [Bradyrhizobium sp. LHD-71]